MNTRSSRLSGRFVRYAASVAAALVVAVLLAGEFPPESALGQGKPDIPTVYDRALQILKDFVKAGDHRLGFADTTEFAGAYIDTSRSILIYQRIIDSLKAYRMFAETVNVFHDHRTLFPVVVDTVVHSYVVFDSVFDSGLRISRWKPVQYSASRQFER